MRARGRGKKPEACRCRSVAGQLYKMSGPLPAPCHGRTTPCHPVLNSPTGLTPGVKVPFPATRIPRWSFHCSPCLLSSGIPFFLTHLPNNVQHSPLPPHSHLFLSHPPCSEMFITGLRFLVLQYFSLLPSPFDQISFPSFILYHPD